MSVPVTTLIEQNVPNNLEEEGQPPRKVARQETGDSLFAQLKSRLEQPFLYPIQFTDNSVLDDIEDDNIPNENAIDESDDDDNDNVVENESDDAEVPCASESDIGDTPLTSESYDPLLSSSSRFSASDDNEDSVGTNSDICSNNWPSPGALEDVFSPVHSTGDPFENNSNIQGSSHSSSSSTTGDGQNEAYQIIQNYMNNPLMWEKLRNFLSRGIKKHAISTAECVTKFNGNAELNSLLEDTNTGPFFHLFKQAINEVAEFPIIKANSNQDADKPGEMPESEIQQTDESMREISEESTRENNETHSDDYTVEGDQRNSLSNSTVSNMSTGSVSLETSETSNISECVYDRLARVSEDVYSQACELSGPENSNRMISSCGKILLHAVFSDKELLEGNPTGRKKSRSSEPVKKYDVKKIITIAKFLSWIKSQPDDRSMERFKEYESATKETGLSAVEFRYFKDNVIIKYTCDFRKKKETNQT